MVFLVTNLAWLSVFKIAHHVSDSILHIQQKLTHFSLQLSNLDHDLKQAQLEKQKQQAAQQQQGALLQQHIDELLTLHKNVMNEQLQRIEIVQQALLKKCQQKPAIPDKAAIPPHSTSQQLPFAVLGIDMWNGVPKVTVRLKNQLNLLSVNDSVAGWTLTQVDVEAGSAVFHNAQQQPLKMSIGR